MTNTRTVLICGASGGLGFAVATALDQAGWRVVLHGNSHENRLHRLADQLRVSREVCLLSDLSERGAASALVSAAREVHGQLDALVNLVGPYRRVSLLEEDGDAWRDIFETNLHFAFDLTQAAIPIMRLAGWGRIAHFAMARASQLVAQSHVTAYALAKASVIGMTRSFAKVVAADGITVNTISPGFIDSGPHAEPQLKETGAKLPAARMGRPEEVAATVRFVLSDEAAYLNGADISVSGGW